MCLRGWIFGFTGGGLRLVVWLVICLVYVGCWWVWFCGWRGRCGFVVLCVDEFGRPSLLKLRLGVYVTLVFIDDLCLRWVCGVSDLTYGCSAWCFCDFVFWFGVGLILWVWFVGLVCWFDLRTIV